MGLSLLYAALIGGVFVIWPIVGKTAGATGAWTSLIVMGGSLLPIVVFGHKQLVSGPPLTAKMVGWLLVAAVMNGTAVLVYGTMAADKNIQTGSFLATVYMFMIVFAPVADIIMNHSAISWRIGAGVACAIGAIYFLKGN